MNGHNVVTWANLNDSGITAVTVFWYSLASGEIVEFDIANNTLFAWEDHDIGGADPNQVGVVEGSASMDQLNIDTHEAGHALGALNDEQKPACGDATMFYASQEGEVKKRSLEKAESDAIGSAYGGGSKGNGNGKGNGKNK